MDPFPEKDRQILAANAGLIRFAVLATHNRALLPQLEPILLASERNGWTRLVAAIRKVLAGQRDAGVLLGLDHEDRVVVDAILHGLRNPALLDQIDTGAEPRFAAPGLAALIDAASKGNAGALQLVAGMAEQMTAVPGDLARLGATLRQLIDGERNAQQLCQGMGPQGAALVAALLDELGRRSAH